MIQIRPGVHGDELPTLTDVTQEDIDYYLDPEAKDVPELRADPGADERERLEGVIRDGDETTAAMAKAELVCSQLFYRDRPRARDLASEAEAVARRIGDPLLLAESHHAFAQANNYWGVDSQTVASRALEAEYLYHDLGKPHHEALMIWFRMLTAVNRSAWSAAVDLVHPILELLKEPGETGDVFRFSVYGRVFSLLRAVAVGAGSPLDLLRRCVVLTIAYSRVGEFPLTAAFAHSSLGNSLIDCGEYGIGRAHLRRAYLISQRIETIGDGYLAVSGLTSEPEPEENGPAVRLVRAALDIQDYLDERNRRADELGGPKFQARIGLHLGGIIGGIVGRNRIRFGIFGDAVNTTQRLEAACRPGGICVSGELRDALAAAPDAGEFALVPEGTAKAKGKGTLKVWYVERGAARTP